MRRTWAHAGRSEAWSFTTAILSVAPAIPRARSLGTPEPETGTEVQFGPHRRGRATGHPPPLPRSRRLGRHHRPEAPPGRVPDRHQERGTHHREVRPSKKNSIATA